MERRALDEGLEMLRSKRTPQEIAEMLESHVAEHDSLRRVHDASGVTGITSH